MKGKLTILVFLMHLTLLGQEAVLQKDSISTVFSNEFIEDHKKRFNVKMEVGNDIAAYSLVQDNIEIDLKPNLNLRYALVFSYKFLSVRIGVRPRISDEEKEIKGDSDTFRLRLEMLFDNWNHLIEYNADRGYYVENTKETTGTKTDNNIQFPQLRTYVLFGSSSYKLNKNYSMRAIQSQTEIQTKSAGSLMPGIGYNFYKIEGTHEYKNSEGELIQRDFYNDYNGINLALQLGYYYTFVFKGYWYLNANVTPSTGIDFYQTTNHSQDKTTSQNFSDHFFALNYGVGGGYNAQKFFFGAMLKNRFTDEKFSSNKVRLLPSQNTFSVFFGYRFKAPKTVSKPVDLIENKVPILKDDKN